MIILTDEKLTLKLDKAIRDSIEPDFKENKQKINKICRSIYNVLIESGIDNAENKTEELFEIVKAQSIRI